MHTHTSTQQASTQFWLTKFPQKYWLVPVYSRRTLPTKCHTKGLNPTPHGHRASFFWTAVLPKQFHFHYERLATVADFACCWLPICIIIQLTSWTVLSTRISWWQGSATLILAIKKADKRRMTQQKSPTGKWQPICCLCCLYHIQTHIE